MAYDKVVDSAILDAELKQVADAIRAKGNTADQLVFPDGFVAAVESISAGGGDIDALIDGSITEVTSNVVSVSGHCFYYRTKLEKSVFPLATSIGGNAFKYCSALQSVDFPIATTIGSNAFAGCSALQSVDFPMVTLIDGYAFDNCNKLQSVDFPLATTIGSYAFATCSALQRFILRKSDSITTLSNTSAFTNTPIAKGTGYIYVPRSLVDSYKSATNWSTYANQFRALEDYTVDGTITGALDESKI